MRIPNNLNTFMRNCVYEKKKLSTKKNQYENKYKLKILYYRYICIILFILFENCKKNVIRTSISKKEATIRPE